MEHVKAYGGNTCNDEQHQCTGQVTVSTTISRQIPDYVRAQLINKLTRLTNKQIESRIYSPNGTHSSTKRSHTCNDERS